MNHPEDQAVAPVAGPAPAPSSADDRSNASVVREILSGIYDGRYAPGQRLIEPDLVRQLGVSRSSVREALQRLAAEGIVQLETYKGAYVRRLTRQDLRGVIEVMEVLHGLAARLAATNLHQPGARDDLTASFERLMSFKGASSYMDVVRARNAFYRTITQIAGNAELIRILPTTHIHLGRIIFRLHETPAETSRFDDYAEMFAAISSGDPQRAEQAGRQHFIRMLRDVDAIPSSAFPSDG